MVCSFIEATLYYQRNLSNSLECFANSTLLAEEALRHSYKKLHPINLPM